MCHCTVVHTWSNVLMALYWLAEYFGRFMCCWSLLVENIFHHYTCNLLEMHFDNVICFHYKSYLIMPKQEFFTEKSNLYVFTLLIYINEDFGVYNV